MGGKGSGRPKGSSSTSKWIRDILSDGKPHYGFEIYTYVKEKSQDTWYAKNPTYSSVVQLLRVLRYLGLIFKLTAEEVRSLGLDITPDYPNRGGGSIKGLHAKAYVRINSNRKGDKEWENPEKAYKNNGSSPTLGMNRGD